MIPPCGTFQYLAEIPDTWTRHAAGFLPALYARTHGGKAPLFRRDSLDDNRLVGYDPEVWIQSDRIVLVACKRRFAQFRAASLGVHPDLLGLMKAGDVLHMARTHCGGIALAIVRQKELVIAVGALTQLESLLVLVSTVNVW